MVYQLIWVANTNELRRKKITQVRNHWAVKSHFQSLTHYSIVISWSHDITEVENHFQSPDHYLKSTRMKTTFTVSSVNEKSRFSPSLLKTVELKGVTVADNEAAWWTNTANCVSTVSHVQQLIKTRGGSNSITWFTHHQFNH